MIGLIVQAMLLGRCWKLTKNKFVLVTSIVFITAGHVTGICMVGMGFFGFSIPANTVLVIDSNNGREHTIRVGPHLGYVFSRTMHHDC